MRNVVMIRPDPGLVTIPVEKAVYCRGCDMVTNSIDRCGVGGSDRIVELAPLFSNPRDPGPVPAVTLAA